MKKSGIIIFVDATPSFILDRASLEGRPLLKDREKIFNLYRERIESYRRCADFVVSNDGILSKVCTKTEETFTDKLPGNVKNPVVYQIPDEALKEGDNVLSFLGDKVVIHWCEIVLDEMK